MRLIFRARICQKECGAVRGNIAKFLKKSCSFFLWYMLYNINQRDNVVTIGVFVRKDLAPIVNIYMLKLNVPSIYGIFRVLDICRGSVHANNSDTLMGAGHGLGHNPDPTAEICDRVALGNK